MHKKITKAVIPAAGFGTRFLPWTKAMPKEMLPIVDKPVIQYVVEECVASGIEDIIMVTGYHKRGIEDHFDEPNLDLIENLKMGGAKKKPLLESVKSLSSMANFVYVRQKGGYGNATPVKNVQHLIGDEPFAVLWGDEFIYSDPPRLKQCIEVYEKYGDPVISGIEMGHDADLSRYGIADLEKVGDRDNVFKIKKIIEKPDKGQEPSRVAVHGAYILTPDIFEVLDEQKPGTGGEYYLPEAIDELRQRGRSIYTCVVRGGRYYDTGNKLEYLKTIVDFAMDHEELGEDFTSYLRSRMSVDH